MLREAKYFKFVCKLGVAYRLHIVSMATEANRDAAEQSLEIAKGALATGNIEKAQKFAEKAMKLYPSDEVCLA